MRQLSVRSDGDIDFREGDLTTTGKMSVGSLKVSDGATSGYYLQSDASGNGIWATISGTVPSGSASGDFLRWNNTTSIWESKSEPIALKEVVFTPATTPISDIEGAVYYNSTNKSIMVCTEI